MCATKTLTLPTVTDANTCQSITQTLVDQSTDSPLGFAVLSGNDLKLHPTLNSEIKTYTMEASYYDGIGTFSQTFKLSVVNTAP
jgi:hypothetical protein